ncbi:hypothetical protein C8J56DRAFT_1042682 [Mycena floridula]|nr:hypothetical protein C8J56DRAFT_1042682 [Mycena floridula]
MVAENYPLSNGQPHALSNGQPLTEQWGLSVQLRDPDRTSPLAKPYTVEQSQTAQLPKRTPIDDDLPGPSRPETENTYLRGWYEGDGKGDDKDKKMANGSKEHARKEHEDIDVEMPDASPGLIITPIVQGGSTALSAKSIYCAIAQPNSKSLSFTNSTFFTAITLGHKAATIHLIPQIIASSDV